MVHRVLAVVAVGILSLACFPHKAWAQTTASPPVVASSADMAALTQEVQNLRRSVDGLLDTIKKFVVESGQRERVTLLLRRIEIGEQQVNNLTAELRTLRGKLDVSEATVQQSRGRINSARSMEAFHPDAKSAEVLAQEQTRAVADEQVAQSSADRLERRIAELEGEIVTRRVAILALETQLQKELQKELAVTPR